jgi:hypothetical protein
LYLQKGVPEMALIYLSSALITLSLMFSPVPIQEPLSALAHPYYVSVTELEWNGKEKEVQVSCKLFTDDFEEALKQSGKSVDLAKGNKANNQAGIESYLRQHFVLKINGKALPLTIAGYENDQEATWVYLQGPCSAMPAEMDVTNSLLYEIKKEQVNIVHLKAVDQRKSFRLVNPDTGIHWKVLP